MVTLPTPKRQEFGRPNLVEFCPYMQTAAEVAAVEQVYLLDTNPLLMILVLRVTKRKKYRVPIKETYCDNGKYREFHMIF